MMWNWIRIQRFCSLLGSQEGLAHIALSIADEGDIVMVPDPCYPVFGDGPQIAGAELYYMPLKKENDYIIQLQGHPGRSGKKSKTDGSFLIQTTRLPLWLLRSFTETW
mgnify:CR=1 FL=1